MSLKKGRFHSKENHLCGSFNDSLGFELIFNQK